MRGPRKPLDERGARESALRALGRREHSAAELKAKLQRRGVAPEAAGQTVTELGARGWQSDARYAEVLVRSRIHQGCGPQRIASELAAAGLPDAQIKAAVAGAACDWAALAAQVRARRFHELPRGAAQWQQQFRFLAGRGFAPEHIYACLKELPD